MIIEQVVVARLLSVPAVAAIVGDRVSPIVLRQTTRDPVLVYQRIYGQRSYSLAAPVLAETQIQITCWAGDYATARTLADAVRKALDAWASAVDEVEIALVNDGADTYAEDYDMVGCTVLATIKHQED